MRKLALVALIVLAPLFELNAHAATSSVTITWAAPAAAVDGSALTGAQALTKYEAFISTAVIPDSPTGTPTATITAGTTTTTQSITVLAGDTIHARVRACNAAGCSVLSNDVTAVVPISKPGPPTSVTITINLG